ncbi:MAG: hypothetical protein HYY20_06770 [Candidatus Tectomicrobia bacterium]|uniref:Uncharacterized protein n=1 Tax=Tectimicrobiota bacterium TaxID=2528274 RepID=A0A932CNC6_UNCTE|nr:hypothetical protein [Candidatus Tectomicrobia bacterium]
MKAAFRKGQKEPFLLDTSSPDEMQTVAGLRRNIKVLEYELNKDRISWDGLSEEECRALVSKKATLTGFTSSQAEKISQLIVETVQKGQADIGALA